MYLFYNMLFKPISTARNLFLSNELQRQPGGKPRLEICISLASKKKSPPKRSATRTNSTPDSCIWARTTYLNTWRGGRRGNESAGRRRHRDGAEWDVHLPLKPSRCLEPCTQEGQRVDTLLHALWNVDLKKKTTHKLATKKDSSTPKKWLL